MTYSPLIKPFEKWPSNFRRLLEHIPQQLHLKPKNFVLVGSAPLCVRGVRDTSDLDMFLRNKSLFDEIDTGEDSAAEEEHFQLEPLDPQLSLVNTNTQDPKLFSSYGAGVKRLRQGDIKLDFAYKSCLVAGLPSDLVFATAQSIHGFQVLHPRLALAIKSLVGRAKDFLDISTLSLIVDAEQEEENFNGTLEKYLTEQEIEWRQENMELFAEDVDVVPF